MQANSPSSCRRVNVDAAKAGADRRGDRGLQGTAGAADAFQHAIGQRRARAGHHIDAGLLHVPIDFHAGGIDAHAGGLGQFGSGAIASNQGNFVSHRASSSAQFLQSLPGGPAATSTVRAKLTQPLASVNAVTVAAGIRHPGSGLPSDQRQPTFAPPGASGRVTLPPSNSRQLGFAMNRACQKRQLLSQVFRRAALAGVPGDSYRAE